jgi:hypothetical protein
VGPVDPPDALRTVGCARGSVGAHGALPALAVVAGESVFNLHPEGPGADPKKFIVGKYISIVETAKTTMTCASPSQVAFKECVPFLEKHQSHLTIEYTKFLIVEFVGVDQMEQVYSELKRNKCDMVGV